MTVLWLYEIQLLSIKLFRVCEIWLQNLSEKNKKYKQKLEKEEMTKRQQMRILCKTQEINLMEKDKLIGNLQSLVEEQEGRLVEAETATNSK